MVLLLAACRSGSEEEFAQDECYLTIYVYAPGNPLLTRADVDHRDATTEENAIKKLQLWVYKHATGELVSYLEKENVEVGSSSASVFTMIISPEFANNPENVDVYALANVSDGNTGYTFNRETSRATLDAAVLEDDFFGVEAGKLVQSVPADGLPMTAILKDQTVVGTFPALRVGTTDAMATMLLTRTVSKVRFVLCRAHDVDDTAKQLQAITGIKLNTNMIPSQTYLTLEQPFDNSLNPTNLLGASRCHIADAGYESTEALIGAVAHENIGTIPVQATPGETWTYNTTTHGTWAQYLNAINQGIANGDLLELGTTYLRESDKKITGSITYTVVKEPDTERFTPFEMDRAGDFTRNHSWTVLVMFEGGQMRVLNVVDIAVRTWNEKSIEPHEVYNW